MEQNKFDDQLKEYFQLHKTELKDDEFTKRVMQKLARKKTPFYIVYLFLVLGVLLFLTLNGFDRTIMVISDLTAVVPELKLSSIQSLGVVIVFVVVIFSISIVGIDSDDSMLQI